MVKILFVITAMYFARPPTGTVELGGKLLFHPLEYC
jgi:hypothetical protein